MGTSLITADDLLRWFDRYGWTDTCSGEWWAIQRQQRSPLREALALRSYAGITRVMDQALRSDLYFGLVSLPGNSCAELVAAFPVAMYWRAALWFYLTNQRDFALVEAPNVCNQLVYRFDDVPVAIDSFRFDHYADTISRYVRPDELVLEIGSGYGGVALQLQRRLPGLRLVLVDLAETLYIAAWFLSRALPEVSLGWWDEAPDATVRLVPLQDRDHLNVAPVVIFAAHTFSGLPPEEVAAWMAWIDGSGANYLYHDDVLHPPLKPGVWLTDSYPEVTIDAMPRPTRYRELWRRRIPWAGWEDRFTEIFWRRV